MSSCQKHFLPHRSIAYRA